MKLDEFISETLLQIINGVVKAQEGCRETTAFVAYQGNSMPIKEVEFDVALTVESGTKTKGGIGVLTGMVNLGSAGESDKAQTAVNKIRFTIPVCLPSDPTRRLP